MYIKKEERDPPRARKADCLHIESRLKEIKDSSIQLLSLALFPKALNNFLKNNIFVDTSDIAVFLWNGDYKYVE